MREPGLLGEQPDACAKAAVSEVLRVEPIAPFTARLVLEDIEYRGVRFPAGTLVAVCAERANLARAELEEALTFLAPRMPGLALDGEPVLGGVEGIYNVDSLPLHWS